MISVHQLSTRKIEAVGGIETRTHVIRAEGAANPEPSRKVCLHKVAHLTVRKKRSVDEIVVVYEEWRSQDFTGVGKIAKCRMAQVGLLDNRKQDDPGLRMVL